MDLPRDSERQHEISGDESMGALFEINMDASGHCSEGALRRELVVLMAREALLDS